jgi:MFS superfamily sulfate permease-like transporter
VRIEFGRWLQHYDPGWFRSDLAAGVTLAAYVLPAALGDASLAGLPPQAGLYACLFGGLVFWLLCSSRHTCISVTSAISLLVGSSLGNLAGGDPTRLGALAACAALLTATIAFVAWLARAGSVVNFISETVLIGFKARCHLLQRATAQPAAFLGRIPGARRYSDLGRHPDNEATPGVLAFRVESGIVYFTAGHVFNTVLLRLDATREPLRVVICDLSSSPNVDMTGARMLLTLHAELAKRGIAFRLVEARSTVRDMLRVEGVEKVIGHIDRFTTLADAIEDFQH